MEEEDPEGAGRDERRQTAAGRAGNINSQTKLTYSNLNLNYFYRTSDFPQRPPGEEAAQVRRRDRIAAGGQETGAFEN